MFDFTVKNYKVTHFKNRPKKADFYPFEIIGRMQRCYRLLLL